MKKLALYGYGIYGKRASESFRLYWGGEYLVTAVFDREPAGKRDLFWDLPVLGTDRLSEEYRKGVFEAVMICIFDHRIRDEVGGLLDSLGIPAFVPGTPEDFADPGAFLQAEDPGITINAENYNFHVYRNMLGAAADFERKQFFFLFNEDGKISVDNFRNYPESYRHLVLYPFRLKDPLPEKVYMKGSYCLIAKAYSTNYWHFTFEAADCVYLLERSGYRGKYIYNDLPFSRELLMIMGISPDRLIRTIDLDVHKVYVFETLVDLNHDRLLLPHEYNKVLSQMAGFLQTRLRSDPLSPKKLYIRRIGVRRLLNAEEIAVKNGYTVMVPEEHSVEEQMTLFHNADVVLCPHGANSTNFLYMRKGSVFVEIFSDRWPPKMNGTQCRDIGVRYLEMTGTAREDGSAIYADYTVDEDELQQMICRAESLAAENGDLPLT